MSEETKQTDAPPVEAAPGEKHSAIITRGISMPAHEVRAADRKSVV